MLQKCSQWLSYYNTWSETSALITFPVIFQETCGYYVTLHAASVPSSLLQSLQVTANVLIDCFNPLKHLTSVDLVECWVYETVFKINKADSFITFMNFRFRDQTLISEELTLLSVPISHLV